MYRCPEISSSQIHYSRQSSHDNVQMYIDKFFEIKRFTSSL